MRIVWSKALKRAWIGILPAAAIGVIGFFAAQSFNWGRAQVDPNLGIEAIENTGPMAITPSPKKGGNEGTVYDLGEPVEASFQDDELSRPILSDGDWVVRTAYGSDVQGLSVVVFNATASPAALVEMTVEVEKSETVAEPIPYLTSDFCRADSFVLLNDGWGTANDLVLRGQLILTGDSSLASPSPEFSAAQVSTDPAIQQRYVSWLREEYTGLASTHRIGAVVPVYGAVRSLPAGNRIFFAISPFLSGLPLTVAESVRANKSGVVGKLAAVVEFTYVDAGKRMRARRVLSTDVLTETGKGGFECGLGGGSDASRFIVVPLKSSGQNYSVLVPVNHVVASGSQARVDTFIKVDRSSRHTMRFRAKFADGRTRLSAPVTTKISVANSGMWTDHGTSSVGTFIFDESEREVVEHLEMKEEVCAALGVPENNFEQLRNMLDRPSAMSVVAAGGVQRGPVEVSACSFRHEASQASCDLKAMGRRYSCPAEIVRTLSTITFEWPKKMEAAATEAAVRGE